MTAIDNLNAVLDEMNRRFVAREEDLTLLARCVVADCHMLIIGPPGTAKSILFYDFFSFL